MQYIGRKRKSSRREMFPQNLQGQACSQDEGNFIGTERSIGSFK